MSPQSQMQDVSIKPQLQKTTFCQPALPSIDDSENPNKLESAATTPAKLPLAVS